MVTPARLLAALVSLVLLAAGLTGAAAPVVALAPAVAAYPHALAPTDRLFGPDRYATATAVSRAAFPTTFPRGTGTVYLARGDVFADALAGGSLTDGPVLLVRSCGAVPGSVTTEVARLNPARVVALGGTQAICDDVLRTVANGRPTGRLAGTSRYATAAAISRHAFGSGPVSELYVATGADSPDAVAGGVLTRGPVLLLPASGVPGAVRDEIARLNPGRVVALGGQLAVPDDQLGAVADGRPTGRLAGSNRYATAAAIAAHQFPSAPATAYVARGDVYADAIAGGALTDGPILLVNGSSCGSLPTAVHTYLRSVQPGRVVALGGSLSLCDSTLTAAARSARGLHFVTTEVPPGAVNQPYETTIEVASGSSLPVSSVSAVGLPPGLFLYPHPTDRYRTILRGHPVEPGTFTVSAEVHEGYFRDDLTTRTFSLVIAPSPPGTGMRAGDVAYGYRTGCAATDAGEVHCWGDGAFDRPTDEPLGGFVPTPWPVQGLTGRITAVSVGGGHQCALGSTGTVQCWGGNHAGQLGDGTVSQRRGWAAPVVGLPPLVRSVGSGGSSSCAVADDGSAWCWGGNAHGQLGDGTTTDRSTPARVGLPEPAATIVPGARHTCAVGVSGAVWCWGDNSSGQLGDGTSTDRPTPTRVPGLAPARSVATGDTFTCAVHQDGAATCWGNNHAGQLGRPGGGSEPWGLPPAPVEGLSEPLSTLRAGSSHACATTVGGAVLCWGSNDQGQVAPGQAQDQFRAVPVAGLPGPVSAVVAGEQDSCALTVTGGPWCWGSPDGGRTGSGLPQVRTPLPVAGFVRD